MWWFALLGFICLTLVGLTAGLLLVILREVERMLRKRR